MQFWSSWCGSVVVLQKWEGTTHSRARLEEHRPSNKTQNKHQNFHKQTYNHTITHTRRTMKPPAPISHTEHTENTSPTPSQHQPHSTFVLNPTPLTINTLTTTNGSVETVTAQSSPLHPQTLTQTPHPPIACAQECKNNASDTNMPTHNSLHTR